MTADRLDRIAEIEDGHFWFTARQRIVADALQRLSLPIESMILDVGCGTGSFLRSLPDPTRAVGIEPLGRVADFVTDGGPHLVRGSALMLPVRSSSIDVALALDVIEHIDDAQALRELRRVVRSNGYLVVTVPAGPRLWSARDVDAGHLRRYTRRSLRSTLSEAGCEVMRCSPFHGALLPLLVGSRMLGRRSTRSRDLEDRPPAFANAALSRITAMEAALAERGLRPPWGSSLVATARVGE